MVMILEPKNLMEAMVKAWRVEENNRILEKLPMNHGKVGNVQKSVPVGQKWVKDWLPANNKMTGLRNMATTGNGGWKGRRTFHDLSPAEVSEKARKGECFTCEKYNPIHVCKNKQFRLMMIMEEEDEEEPKNQQQEKEEEDMGKFHQLSLHSIEGLLPKNL